MLVATEDIIGEVEARDWAVAKSLERIISFLIKFWFDAICDMFLGRMIGNNLWKD